MTSSFLFIYHRLPLLWLIVRRTACGGIQTTNGVLFPWCVSCWSALPSQTHRPLSVWLPVAAAMLGTKDCSALCISARLSLHKQSGGPELCSADMARALHYERGLRAERSSFSFNLGLLSVSRRFTFHCATVYRHGSLCHQVNLLQGRLSSRTYKGPPADQLILLGKWHRC